MKVLKSLLHFLRFCLIGTMSIVRRLLEGSTWSLQASTTQPSIYLPLLASQTHIIWTTPFIWRLTVSSTLSSTNHSISLCSGWNMNTSSLPSKGPPYSKTLRVKHPHHAPQILLPLLCLTNHRAPLQVLQATKHVRYQPLRAHSHALNAQHVL